MLHHYLSKIPKIHDNSFIAEGAHIVGNVEIAEEVSVWFNCVIRGDVESVSVGKRTNIQDGTIIHVTRNGFPTYIGSNVTIGHRALLHACTLNDYCFIGMGAIVMDRAVVHSHAMIAAGALITPGKIINSGELWAGSPAKFIRRLTDQEIEHIPISANNYVKHMYEYQNFRKNI